jgi:hypothetical protein
MSALRNITGYCIFSSVSPSSSFSSFSFSYSSSSDIIDLGGP